MRTDLIRALRDTFNDNQYGCRIVMDHQPHRLRPAKCIAIVGDSQAKIGAALFEWVQEVSVSDRAKVWDALDFARKFLADAKASNEGGWPILFNEYFQA